MAPTDLRHCGLEEEVGHGSGGGVEGSQGDSYHGRGGWTAIKVELDLETSLLEHSDWWDIWKRKTMERLTTIHNLTHSLTPAHPTCKPVASMVVGRYSKGRIITTLTELQPNSLRA